MPGVTINNMAQLIQEIFAGKIVAGMCQLHRAVQFSEINSASFWFRVSKSSVIELADQSFGDHHEHVFECRFLVGVTGNADAAADHFI